ncbi:MAG: hypothetical protein RSF67_08705, partial [Clostridia bacterium]
MKLIAESYNEYNAEYNLITEGILDNIRNSINLTDKRKWLKYAVIAYLSALGIKDYNDAELQSQLNKAIHQEITVFDIKQIANIISNAADKAESLFNNY